MVKNSKFFLELFGPPCRNPLADLDGSAPECAQVCALHIVLHLASLRKIEMVAVCKGVRCPPIFSLYNLFNVGWLVRKCVDIYISPLIAGTNRKAFCCMLALRWRTVAASDRQLLILLRSKKLMSERLHTYECHNGHRLDATLTNEDKERLVTWPLLRYW